MSDHRVILKWNSDFDNHIDIYCEECDVALLCAEVEKSNMIEISRILEANEEHEAWIKENKAE